MSSINTRNTNTQKRWDFAGSALPAEWSIIALGAGQSVSVASSLLSIVAGTTAGAETIVRCSTAFGLKFIARFIARLSQRIVNQNFYLEVTNAAGTTFARWDLNGATATTGQVVTQNQGTANTALAVTIPTTASFVTFEVYGEFEQTLFAACASNANVVKSGNAMFDRLTLEPSEQYYLQVRVLNGGTAPASSTTFDIDAVLLEDLETLAVEIIRGDGSSHPATAQAVRVQGGTCDAVTTVTTVTTANAVPKITQYTDSTTPLAGAATFTGTARDTGAAPVYSEFRSVCFSDQACTHYMEQSADNTTWTTTKTTAVTAGTAINVSDNIVMRYQRVRVLNGATAQGAFRLYSEIISLT